MCWIAWNYDLVFMAVLNKFLSDVQVMPIHIQCLSTPSGSSFDLLLKVLCILKADDVVGPTFL